MTDEQDTKKKNFPRLWEVNISTTLQVISPSEPDEQFVIKPIKDYIRKAVNVYSDTCKIIASSISISEDEWEGGE